MPTLSLGEVTFVADSDGIAVMAGDDPDKRVTLSAQEISRLEGFLRRHASRERRVGFRVPVAPLPDPIRAAFRVQLRLGARILVVTAVDLSLTGILVEAPGLIVQHGAEVPVRLNFDDLECRLTGKVVRLDGEQMALHFLQSLKDGELEPPEPLLTMYRTLETEWLRIRRADD